MVVPLPPPEPMSTPPAAYTFQPGLLEQDFYTLPLEGALIGLGNTFYTKRAHPLWPFQFDAQDNAPVNKKDRQNNAMLVGGAATVGAGLLTSLSFSNESFPVGTFARGWLHSELLTELATTYTKVTFQRPRPFYGTLKNQKYELVADIRFSFWSGHAAHAFSFATYSSLMAINYSPIPELAYLYTASVYGIAYFVGAARIAANAHHSNDVIVGALAGTLIGTGVFYRTKNTYESRHAEEQNAPGYTEVTPLVTYEGEKTFYGVSLNMNL